MRHIASVSGEARLSAHDLLQLARPVVKRGPCRTAGASDGASGALNGTAGAVGSAGNDAGGASGGSAANGGGGGSSDGFWDSTGIPAAKNVTMFEFLNRTNAALPMLGVTVARSAE
ncbi:MAG TPA: hypothetical protein VHW01_11945 [Polyangiaceae bacterium]|nr:hypothetical protein [Polyangiaceae bacterium]